MSKKTYAAIILAAIAIIFVGCRIISAIWLNAVMPKERKETFVKDDSLDPKVRSALEKLDGDYAKIRWGCEYSIFGDFPEIVVSIAPYYTDPYHYLAVAVTNVTPEEVVFSGDMQAKAADDEVIGTGFFFKEHIGSGCTIMLPVFCGTDKAPDGRIHWSNVELEAAEEEVSLPWTSEWNISKDPSFKRAQAKVLIGETGFITPDIKMISAFLVDGEGNILSGATEYFHEKPVFGRYQADLDFYIDGPSQERISDMAVFAGFR